jgi:hypothetical protein
VGVRPELVGRFRGKEERQERRRTGRVDTDYNVWIQQEQIV